MVSGVYLQPGGRGAEGPTCRVFVSVDGFGSSVPGHGHVSSSPRTAQGQDAVRRVAQVKHWNLYWQGGRTTTQKQPFILYVSTGTIPVCLISAPVATSSQHLLVPKKCHQRKDAGGSGGWRRTDHLTASDLQLGSNSASLQFPKRPRHRPRAA